MLARQGPEGKEPLFGVFKFRGVEIEVLKGAGNARLRIAQLDQRTRQRGQRFVKHPVGALGHPVKPAQRIRQRAFAAAKAQKFGGAGNIGADLLRPLHQTSTGVEFCFLADLRVQRVQLGHGMAQEVFFGAHLVQRSARGDKRLAGVAQGAPCLAGGRALLLQPGKGIEQIAVPPRVQQAPIVMLPMQFHQRFGKAAQHFAGGPTIIDPGGLAPVRRIHPAQDQLVTAGQSGVLKDVMGGMIRGQIEDGNNFALRCPLSHQFRTPAPTQNKTQRIQQDRFARAGFSREHVQAGLKRDVQPVDDQHVANVERAQHQDIPGAGEAPPPVRAICP